MATIKKDAAIRKRQQILDSSKKMFLWVAGASVIVGFSLVISWFLWQQVVFKDKVINKKNNTASILQKNNQVAPELTDNVRKLSTNEVLKSARMKSEQGSLQVILDALPADDNKLALGASIEKKLVGGADNVKLETFVIGKENSAEQTREVAAANVLAMPFQMTVSSDDPNALKEMTKRLERSIRTIDIDRMLIEKTDARMTLTISGHAFYMPGVEIKLGEELVKP